MSGCSDRRAVCHLLPWERDAFVEWEEAVLVASDRRRAGFAIMAVLMRATAALWVVLGVNEDLNVCQRHTYDESDAAMVAEAYCKRNRILDENLRTLWWGRPRMTHLRLKMP